MIFATIDMIYLEPHMHPTDGIVSAHDSPVYIQVVLYTVCTDTLLLSENYFTFTWLHVKWEFAVTRKARVMKWANTGETQVHFIGELPLVSHCL